MPDGLYNIEILMRMSKNVREQNDGWRRDHWDEGLERYKQAIQLRAMFEQEYANIDAECKRLEQYAPRTQEPMPKVIAKGPADAPVQRQDAQEPVSSNQVRR